MIEIRRVRSEDAGRLARFFETLEARGVGRLFHPHPLSAESARQLAAYAGKDLYFILLETDDVLGYGMLRGWDEGYDIPSLGMAIHPDAQGQGLGRLLMSFLHVAALRRGASTVRLRVAPINTAAARLYRSLGYELTPEKDGPYLVGLLPLRGPRRQRDR